MRAVSGGTSAACYSEPRLGVFHGSKDINGGATFPLASELILAEDAAPFSVRSHDGEQRITPLDTSTVRETNSSTSDGA